VPSPNSSLEQRYLAVIPLGIGALVDERGVWGGVESKCEGGLGGEEEEGGVWDGSRVSEGEDELELFCVLTRRRGKVERWKDGVKCMRYRCLKGKGNEHLGSSC
jgi:hypothetical protein